MSYDGYGRFRPQSQPRRDRTSASALDHTGPAREFLRAHARECAQHDRSTAAERIRFAGDFLERIADTRNLWCAAVHLAAGGDKAPGPNGQRLYRLLSEDPAGVRAELRRISSALMDDTYQPGRTRRTYVEKANGRGLRPLDIADWQDQIVQRAIVQILDSYLDPELDELSLGYRTGHDRCEALARAAALIELDGRPIALCSDLTDAFTCVPHAPLLTDVESRTGNHRITGLIDRIIRADDRRRGIAQGGPLSPLLLNLYLDRYLDRQWRRERSDTPMIRIADDILILCRSLGEAAECLHDLQRILRPTGMRLSRDKTHTHDLASGATAVWLGYAITRHQDAIRVGLVPDYYNRLRRTLRRHLADADGALLCAAAIRGVYDQLGPLLLWRGS